MAFDREKLSHLQNQPKTDQERSMTNSDVPPISVVIIPVTPLQQNCTMIWHAADNVGAIVDPGGDVDVIMQAIAENDITVEKIILTHGHIDHAAGADELREKLGVEIEGPHIDDKFLLDTLEEKAGAYGIAGARNVTPDRWLDEGETCSIARYNFEVLHCPGHSPGSLVYINRDLRFAFVGDVLFQGSIGRTDFPYGDHDTLIASIKNKLFQFGDDITFICGHGAPSTLGHERESNPFLI